MRNFARILVYLLTLAGVLLAQGEVMEGVALVKLTPDAINPPYPQVLTTGSFGSAEFQAYLSSIGFTEAQKIFDFNPEDTLGTDIYGNPVKLIDLSLFYSFHFDTTQDVWEVLDSLKSFEEVEHAVPSWILRPALTPNDPYYDYYQWALDSLFYTNADINAYKAWNLETGSSSIKVAVLDEGVDTAQPDLRGRVIGGTETADDPWPGWWGKWSDILPHGGHGTNVTGVIGARTDNDTGVAGVMWDVRFFSVRVFTETGIEPITTSEWVAEGIDWARQHGAHMINMSLGWPVSWQWLSDLYSCVTGNPPIISCLWYSDPLFAAAHNAYLSGISLFAAMGNDDNDEPNLPAVMKDVIAVGASNRYNRRVNPSENGWGSNFGSWIDFVAPGVYHYTTKRNGNNYEYFSGTSCATPLALGVAGLVLSVSQRRGLNLSNDDLRHILRLTAEDIEDPGFDERTGFGRIDAYEAVRLVSEPFEVIRENLVGGASELVFSGNWETINGYGGLAAGVYNVDKYKVSRHVTFSEALAENPYVWIREREFKGWSQSNPNDEYPWARITNLSPEGFDIETYVYYVKTRLDYGGTINQWFPAAPQDVVFAFTSIGHRPLYAPTNLNAQNEEASVDLFWQDNSDNEMGFLIYCSEDGQNFGIIDTVWTNGNGIGQRSYTDSTVELEHTYWYKVKAFAQDFHSDESNVDSITTNLLAPSNLSASSYAPWTSVSLTWQDNSNYEDGYIVQRTALLEHPESDDSVVTFILPPGQGPYTFIDTTAKASSDYIYKVWAFRNDGVNSDTLTARVRTYPYYPVFDSLSVASPNGRHMIYNNGFMDAVYIRRSHSCHLIPSFFSRAQTRVRIGPESLFMSAPVTPA